MQDVHDARDDRSLVRRDRAGGSGSFTPTTWAPEGEMELAQWLDHGRRLGTFGRGIAWWIGDWLRYGNARYGEKYVRAARVTGYDVQSLMNMTYVASRFASERRRAALSWSHHAELAALDPAEQDRWLDLAEAQRLSVHALRLEVRTSRPAARRLRAAASSKAVADDATREDAHDVVCPHCRHVIEVAS